MGTQDSKKFLQELDFLFNCKLIIRCKISKIIFNIQVDKWTQKQGATGVSKARPMELVSGTKQNNRIEEDAIRYWELPYTTVRNSNM